MPIGNLTSQIFANIYLHEFDRYIAHVIRPLGFVRYGDDCIMVFSSKKEAESAQTEGVKFVKNNLCLDVHKRNNIVIPTYLGVHFLGCHIFPHGRKLNGRMKSRIPEQLSLRNASSYISIVSQHENAKRKKELLWRIVELL